MKSAKFTKPLYAEIAEGKYDVQTYKETGERWPTQYSKGLSCDGTEIFVLSEELAYSAHVLAKNFSSLIPPDLDKLHLPYPKVVFEAPVTYEIRQGREECTTANGKVPVERVGVYIEQSGTGLFIQPYWRMLNGIVEVTAVAFSTNPDGFDGVLLKPIEIKARENSVDSIKLTAVLSPVWGKMFGDEEVVRVLNAWQKTGLFPAAATEAAEELPFILFSALALINCKSGVTSTRVAKRVAPSGCGTYLKSKLSSPAYTVLSLSEAESVSCKGAVSMRSNISAHYVRGHFKARRSGVYWWNSFLRGTGTLRKRTAYIAKS